MKSTSAKKPIANLPSGVSCGKTVNGRGVEFWRIRLGKRFTGGAVVKRNFTSLAAAKEWFFGESEKKNRDGQSSGVELKAQTGSILNLKESTGTAAFALTSAQIAEASDAFRRLGDSSLTEAVTYFLRNANPAGGRKSFGEVAAEFLTSRKNLGCRPKTLVQYESYLKILNDQWESELINEIKRADIEDWIAESEWAPRTRKNYLVTLTTVFGFALSREYCVENPAEKAERPILDDAPPGILTPEEAKSLLSAANECTPHLIPALAIGLFAGLRRSELCTLDWSEINFEEKFIEVTAGKAKTRKRRLVNISENLGAWLTPYVQKKGPVAFKDESGDTQSADRRLPMGVDLFGEKLKHLVRGREKTASDPGRPAIKDPWPHNAIRHSFGSYFYGKTRNENITAAEMGNSPDMVFKHYRELVRPKEIELYWGIRPD